jgi:hypothetical protein
MERLAFQNWKAFQQAGYSSPPAALYDAVYTYETAMETPEDAYRRFNTNQPADYKGRSLSISDIIEINYGFGTPCCFFCDSIGFCPVIFFGFLAKTRQNFSERLRLLIDDRSACQCLMARIVHEIADTDCDPAKAGRTLIEAFQNKDPDGILLALCGWKLEDLIHLAFDEEF